MLVILAEEDAEQLRLVERHLEAGTIARLGGNGLAAHAVLSRAKLTKLTVWRAIALATERRGRTRVPQALTKGVARLIRRRVRSEEHTSALQSLMRHSYDVFCLKKKKSPLKHYDLSTDHDY